MNSEARSVNSEGLRFLNMIGRLKLTPRTGWVYSGIGDAGGFSPNRVESVADHSWRMAASCLLYSGDPELDTGKMMRLAVVHDIAEVLLL